MFDKDFLATVGPIPRLYIFFLRSRTFFISEIEKGVPKPLIPLHTSTISHITFLYNGENHFYSLTSIFFSCNTKNVLCKVMLSAASNYMTFFHIEGSLSQTPMQRVKALNSK